VPIDRPLIFIGHRGASPLLPAIGAALLDPIGACLFADAGLPHPAFGRLNARAQKPRGVYATVLKTIIVKGIFS
jgi:hypothetical protein